LYDRGYTVDFRRKRDLDIVWSEEKLVVPTVVIEVFGAKLRVR
jgi:hypothetical protein